MNAFKKSIISKSWSSSIRYLFELKDSADKLDDDEKDIKAINLYNNYKDWCNTNHEKLKSNTKFISDIKDHITKSKKADANYYDLKTITL